MGLKERLQKDMIEAMKTRNDVKVGVIRLVRGMIRKLEIDRKKDFTDDDIIGVLSNAAKQRREAIKAYTEGGRDDLVKDEKAELAVIENYLPEALSTDELENIIVEIIAETGAATMKDIGKVMPIVMQKVKGRANGSEVQAIVRSKLS
ncbi:MAG: GatB/YqeY domain-containing protein [Candidatus Marinimicrobia bacterium]|nr:GatB/YqeY domain-containing protein [Candidatus Neomarinimicrobiota bacterium]MBL7066824.1 GatB/YqeY domain-containing protein [Candidatus Neomarinimicrobiota bacterium]